MLNNNGRGVSAEIQVSARQRNWKKVIGVLLLSIGALASLHLSESGIRAAETGPGLDFTVLHGGNRYGKIESCGCATKKAGGIDREANLLAGLRRDAGNVLVFEPGGLLPPNIRPSRDGVTLDYLYQILAHMKYSAINVGPGELKLGVKRLLELQKKTGAPLISANVVGSDGKKVFAPYRLIPISSPSGEKAVVGVTGVTAMRHMVYSDMTSYDKQSRLYKPPFAPHRERLAETLKEMTTKCDVTIVLFDGGIFEGQYLAKKFQPDILITNDRLKILKPKKIGRTYFRSYGLQGKYVARMDFRRNGKKELDILASRAYTILESHPVEKRAHEIVDAYLEAVKKVKGTGARSKVLARKDYMGQDSCIKCHEAQHKHWFGTTHAKAYDALAEKGKKIDDDQLARIVTGWDSPDGFVGLEETPFLLNVQCEVCHGPGRSHFEAENVNSALGKYRSSFKNRRFPSRPRMVMETKLSQELCAQCHSSGFPDDLDFAKALKSIAHPQKVTEKTAVKREK